MTLPRAAAVAVAVAVALSVSACGIESPDETSRERSPIQGANFDVGSVLVRNAYVTYPSIDPATPYIIATFINQGGGPDGLTGVTSPTGSVQFAGTGNPAGLYLPPGLVVRVVDPSLGQPGTTLVLQPSGNPPAVGQSVTATFTFAAGTSQTMRLPVVAAEAKTTQTFQTITPSPAPTPTETIGPPASS